MTEHAIYFGKPEIYQTIRTLGGTWNDIKENPNYFRQHITDIKNHLIQELNYESSNHDSPANQHTLLLTD